MSYAYTPGLKVLSKTIIRKTRVLPVPGEVFVKEGDMVTHDTVISRTYLQGDTMLKPVSYILGVEPRELPQCMLKKVGETFKKGEIIAQNTSFFGIFKNRYYSEIDGKIEIVSEVTGNVAFRSPPVPIERKGYISGKISNVIPGFGAVIESPSSFVQGIFGIGGERIGQIMTIATSDESLTEDKIGNDCVGKILVGGSMITSSALKKASELQVKGIIVGGIDRKDISDFLGYMLGVAITGQEEINTTLIITEGFGNMKIANRTYNLLKSLEGKMASINGATQIRAGVMRPEIIVPLNETVEESEKEEMPSQGMEVGILIRIINEPYFGAIGKVVELPVELQQVTSESFVRVLKVKLDDDRIVTVPRANVEIMEI